jgi:DNA-binding PadR family transcriptional regulator
VTRTDATTTRCAILGQLALRDWSSYELARSTGRTLHWFWPRAESVIYAEARRLEAAGLAASRTEPAADGSRRTRTVYSITDAGREEYERLQAELSPFLDSMIRTVTLIKREIYGDG